MLGTPKGPLGKASIPTKSPFELRVQGRKAAEEEKRPAKRQKTGATEHIASSFFGGGNDIEPCQVRLEKTESVRRAALTDSRGQHDGQPHVRRKESKDQSHSSAETHAVPEKRAALKLVSNPTRRTLVCREQLSKRDAREEATKTKTADGERPTCHGDLAEQLPPHRKRLQERLANLGRKKKIPAISSDPVDPAAPESSLAFDTMESPATRRGSRTLPIDLVSTNNEPDIDHSCEQDSHTRHDAHPADHVPPTSKSFLHPAAKDQHVSKPLNTHPKSGADAPARQPTRRRSPRKQQVNIDFDKTTRPVVKTILAKPYKAPSPPAGAKDIDVGPWSKEAFDLFDWRPPDRDENGKKITISEKRTPTGMPGKRPQVGLSGGVDAPIA